MSRICNIHHACKKCGAPVKGNVRFCPRCAIERKVQAKALKLFGIPPEKISVTVIK